MGVVEQIAGYNRTMDRHAIQEKEVILPLGSCCGTRDDKVLA